MGQGGECKGGIMYWPGKHNPGQSRNLILVCIGEGWEYKRRGGGLKGDSPERSGEHFQGKEGNILQGKHRSIS